jgi:Ca-activated chloride channel family protein
MLSLAAALLGIAVLGPQWGWIEEEIPPRGGRDVLIILDVSRSMLAEDVAPNRLERAKADLCDLAGHLERTGGYRIGLITFAERAAVMCPLTSDFRCFAEELADASLKSLRLRGHADWGDGTQIRLALERASQTIDDANATYTDVVLVSDGEDMTHETLATAESLALRGIAVHTYGLGDSTHGALIPVRDNLGRPAHLRYRGELVYTRFQEDVLRAIADATHGRYFVAATSYRDFDRQLGEVLTAKARLDRQTVHRQRHGIHRFTWFVMPALLLLLIHGLINDARRPGRTVLEPPHYFSWVRRRSAVLHRSLTLAALIALGVESFATSAGSGQDMDPWESFQRGNELLRQAQQAGMNADPAWLLQAQRQYQACLTHQAATPDAGTIVENARHNLEMTKLLLIQVSRSDADVEQADGSDSLSNDPDQQSKEEKPEERFQDLGGGRKPPERAQGAYGPRSESSETGSKSQAQQQQQSQKKPERCPTCLTGQNQSANARMLKEGGQGSASDKEAQSTSNQNAENRSNKARSVGDANSSQGQESGSAPSDILGEDQRSRPGRNNGPEPDARGLFQAESAGANQLQSRSERRFQGESTGTQSGTEKSISTMDPARKAAVLRLNGAIQRIEKRRPRSGRGPESGPEDPANQNRYRDW